MKQKKFWNFGSSFRNEDSSQKHSLLPSVSNEHLLYRTSTCSSQKHAFLRHEYFPARVCVYEFALSGQFLKLYCFLSAKILKNVKNEKIFKKFVSYFEVVMVEYYQVWWAWMFWKKFLSSTIQNNSPTHPVRKNIFYIEFTIHPKTHDFSMPFLFQIKYFQSLKSKFHLNSFFHYFPVL